MRESSSPADVLPDAAPRPSPFAGRFTGLAGQARRGSGYLAQALRMMVGVPDYDTYVAHVRRTHPQAEPMSRAEFIRNRQEARFGRGKAGCC